MQIIKAETQIVDQLTRNLASGDYIIFVDGRILEEGGNFVLVRKERKLETTELFFFTSYKVGGQSYVAESKSAKGWLMNLATTTYFMGLDFTNWLTKEYRDYMLGIQINEQLKAVFIESPMYHIFRRSIVTRKNMQIEFSAVPNDRDKLNAGELLDLLYRFRRDGFHNLLLIEKPTIIKKLYREVPPFYRNGNEFSLAYWRIKDLYNPLAEDEMLKGSLENSQLVDLIAAKKIVGQKNGMEYAFIGNDKMSKAFGLDNSVTFFYSFIIKLIAALTLPMNYLSVTHPHPSMPVLRLTERDPYLKRVVSLQEFKSLSPNEQAMYSKTTAMRAFIWANMSIFESKGYGEITKLIDTLDHATLALKEDSSNGDSISLSII